MGKKFPKRLFIKIDSDPDNKKLSWPIADPEMFGLVGIGVTERLGVYKLIGVREATGVVKHKKIKTRKYR